jgi:TM2 domain-containing membrane protein YozV
MNTPRRPLAALLLVSLCSARAAAADPREAFAQSLLAEGDYFRAITVHKELAFLAQDPLERARHRYLIGKAYRLAQRHDLAVATLAPLVARGDLDPALQGRARLQLALGYLGSGALALSELELQQAAAAGEQPRAALFQGILQLQVQNDTTATLRFDEAARAGDPATARLALRLAEQARALPGLPHRSPALAAVFSALLPGSGQLYVGHAADALQAFGFTGAFGFATYLAYDRDRDRGGSYALTGIAAAITAVFYAANIYGAARTARYFNERQRELVLGDLRRRALALEF